MYEQITNFIKDLGFPIAVAAYLLFWVNKSLQELKKTLHQDKESLIKVIGENTKVISELSIFVKNLNDRTGSRWYEQNPQKSAKEPEVKDRNGKQDAKIKQ